ncbi:unnamed protein product, partial [Orchesella dallaii]
MAGLLCQPLANKLYLKDILHCEVFRMETKDKPERKEKTSSTTSTSATERLTDCNDNERCKYYDAYAKDDLVWLEDYM